MKPIGRFRIEGGRAGYAAFEDGGRTGQIAWEMAAGGSDIHMLVFSSQCRWTSPNSQPMTADEIRRFCSELSKVGGLGIEADVEGRLERFLPDPRS